MNITVNNTSVTLRTDKIPPSVNHAYIIRKTKNGIMRIRTPKFKQYIKDIHDEFPTEWEENFGKGRIITHKFKPLKGKLGAKIIISYGDNRHRDIDNSLKVIFDSLEGVAFENDNQIDYIEVRRDYRDNPDIKVTIFKLEGTMNKLIACSGCGEKFTRDQLTAKYEKGGHGVPPKFIGYMCDVCW